MVITMSITLCKNCTDHAITEESDAAFEGHGLSEDDGDVAGPGRFEVGLAGGVHGL